MKLKYSIEINPVIAVLLIVLALFGVDLMWTRQRSQKRATSRPGAQPAATSSRIPPAQPVASKPTPFGEAIPNAKITVERDEPPAPAAKPRSPFGSRANRPSVNVSERVAEALKKKDAEVLAAAKNGAKAYVEQHQRT